MVVLSSIIGTAFALVFIIILFDLLQYVSSMLDEKSASESIAKFARKRRQKIKKRLMVELSVAAGIGMACIVWFIYLMAVSPPIDNAMRSEQTETAQNIY